MMILYKFEYLWVYDDFMNIFYTLDKIIIFYIEEKNIYIYNMENQKKNIGRPQKYSAEEAKIRKKEQIIT